MRRILLVALSLTLLAGIASLFAQSEPEKLKQTVDKTVGIQKETQQSQDQWEKEKSELVARYRAAQVNVNFLSERKAVEDKRLKALQESIAEMERRLEESDRLSLAIQDTLNTVLYRLDDWVQRDLPFLMEERKGRIDYLKKEIVKPDVSDADKLRSLLEALQIEMDYGSTVEVTQQRIDLGGEELFVDLLRVGRVSVFWRTPDGERCGEYDRGARQWVELPGKYNRNIGTAMDMATRMRPVELLALPLGRIEP
ncbi:MAG: DUF3450 domain-containing protein [Candidatus Latescibacterota bacterium]|jgi:hypothetical protein